jgi:hypothetical protein
MIKLMVLQWVVRFLRTFFCLFMRKNGFIIVLITLNLRRYSRRYVDDSFVLFKTVDHIVPFLDYLNSKHPNIKFTFEIENDDKTLPFLHIIIRRVNGNFETSVYRKLFTNWAFYKLGFLQILKVFYRLVIRKVLFFLCCFGISTSALHIKFFMLN